MQPKHSLLISVSALIFIGVIMVYSSSGLYAWKYFGRSSFFLSRELLFLVIGFIAMTIALNTDYHLLQRHSKKIILLSFFLLLLTFIPPFSHPAGGAKRWIFLFPYGFLKNFSFQPSELAKLSLVLYLSSFFQRHQTEIKNLWRGFVPPFLITLSFAMIVFLQPDLGTSILFFVLFFFLAFSAGARFLHLCSLCLLFLALSPYLILLRPYWIKRIISFLNPFKDPQGAGWQILQSFIAFKNGGLLGVGLGAGKQKLFYLPGCHTDFIFSIIGEELGFLGGSIVIFLYILLLISGMRIAFKARDLGGHLLALGISVLITLGAIVNIGVVSGLLPTKGLPLPFISYGGSALVVDMFAVGILLNIANSFDRVDA
ncbi:MAG: putative lipid II flippase FtsW [Candidatus Omnitrophota bacterium]|nr:MAG: putative lipid II flippase FtsW [Candidatus Omnitrophota bacterium]